MINYKDVHYHTHPQVYQPAEDTFLLAENLQVERRKRVLEIGTGTGLISIIAARKAGMVIATDINPHAIKCAAKNIIANKTFNIELREGNLFETVKNEKFDLILFNTPYLPTSEEETRRDGIDAAWDGGADGRKVIDQFLDGVKDHLNPGGRVQLVQSSLSDIDKTLEKLETLGFSSAVTAREPCFFEEIVILTANLKG
jgi:release factor glutamine methyltransferase